jgi:DNA-binding transcriptional regulator LsrR (DeoR family)
LVTKNNQQLWELKTLEKSTFEKVVELVQEGLSQQEMAFELGISKSRISRHLKRARVEGAISHDAK